MEELCHHHWDLLVFSFGTELCQRITFCTLIEYEVFVQWKTFVNAGFVKCSDMRNDHCGLWTGIFFRVGVDYYLMLLSCLWQLFNKHLFIRQHSQNVLVCMCNFLSLSVLREALRWTIFSMQATGHILLGSSCYIEQLLEEEEQAEKSLALPQSSRMRQLQSLLLGKISHSWWTRADADDCPVLESGHGVDVTSTYRCFYLVLSVSCVFGTC